MILLVMSDGVSASEDSGNALLAGPVSIPRGWLSLSPTVKMPLPLSSASLVTAAGGGECCFDKYQLT